MPLHHYSCVNCGNWQEYFAVPPACPVCSDVRNALPEDGWNFVSAGEMRERERLGEIVCDWRDVEPDITVFSNTPGIGIGSSGYLIRRDTGNIAFECTGWYTEDALRRIEDLGGIATLSSSHPHGFGALWQLQRRFQPEVVFQREAVQFTKAFDVHFPWDDELELTDDITLYYVGGHYEGHSVLYDRKRKALFCGDALKFDSDEHGEITGVSCHKAFHKQIPLSRQEIQKYLDVIGKLDFKQVFTPFEHVPNATTEDAVRLFKEQIAAPRTNAKPMSLRAGK